MLPKYWSCMLAIVSKTYDTRLVNSTFFQPEVPISYRRKTKCVVKVDLQKCSMRFQGLYATYGELRVACSYCFTCDPPQLLPQQGTKAITKAERSTRKSTHGQNEISRRGEKQTQTITKKKTRRADGNRSSRC